MTVTTVTLWAAPVQRLLTAGRALDPGLDVPGRPASVAGRVLLRLAAAEALGVDPRGVELLAPVCPHCGGGHGRPRVAGSSLRLSLARSRDAAVVAVVEASGDVGVALEVGADVEDWPPRATLPSPDVVLSRREQALLQDSPDSTQDRDRTLLRAWTRKEALLKACGHGLAVPPSAVDVTGHEGEAALVAWDEGAAGRAAPPGPVALADVDRDTVLGAVAVVGAGSLAIRWQEGWSGC